MDAENQMKDVSKEPMQLNLDLPSQRLRQVLIKKLMVKELDVQGFERVNPLSQ
jgi:hypothetical protein